MTGLGLILPVIQRIRRLAEHRLTLLVANVLTVLAAALATMVSASGMWKFFTDIIGQSPLRIVFFAYIEVALFASALLARARLLREPEKGTTGVDGVAVWVLAGLTASLAALDASSFRELCLRLAAPPVAAWMWERALAAERSVRLGRTMSRIHWTVTVERILVWLRLAEAQDRDVTEVDRARRRARLGRALDATSPEAVARFNAWRLNTSNPPAASSELNPAGTAEIKPPVIAAAEPALPPAPGGHVDLPSATAAKASRLSSLVTNFVPGRGQKTKRCSGITTAPGGPPKSLGQIADRSRGFP